MRGLLCAAVVAAWAGCQSDKPKLPAPDKVLKAEPLTLTLDAKGTPVELTVRAQNVTWTAQPEAQWIRLSADRGDGDAVIAVSAAVNPDADERRSVLRIEAAEVPPVEIVVQQQGTAPIPPPEPAVITYIEGYWAGDYWETGGVLDDLYLMMTDRTMLDGKLQGAGFVASLDLNIPAATFSTFEIAGSYAPSTVLPPATPYTFNVDEVTYVLTYDASGNRTAQRYATGGSIRITGERPDYRIDASLTFEDGTALQATYQGTILFSDKTTPVLSTLSGDCRPQLAAATGTFLPHPDQADIPLPLQLCLTGTDGAAEATLQLQLLVSPEALDQGAIEGTYRVADLPVPSDAPQGTALPGTLSPDSEELGFEGSWYLLRTAQGALNGIAPLRGGQVVIARSGERYTIDFTLTDDNLAQPHTVSGHYEGPIDFTNLPDPGPGPGDATADGTLVPWTPGGRW